MAPSEHGDGLAPLAGQPDDEAVFQEFGALRLRQGASEELSHGRIVIKEEHVEWVPDGEQEPAWTLDFHAITMHAIVSADEDQAAALYLQVCIGDDYPEEEEESEEEGGDGQAALGPDLWLIPDDPEAVPALYEAFSAGAERNPDVDSDEDSDASGSGFCFNEEEALQATGVLAREIAEIENGNADRFEDAEEEEA